MSRIGDTAGPFEKILDELRRMRSESMRREEELWEAVDEIRRLVSTGARESGGADRDDHLLDPYEYRRLKGRVRRFVARALPEGGRVSVVSRGDEELLDLPGCTATHFPQDPTGSYTGFYPRDGTPAVAHFEWVRAGGAEYLLFPGTALWWLEEYPLLAAHLAARCPRVASEDGVGVLYDLQPREEGGAWPDRVRQLLDAWGEHTGTEPSVLDWNTGLELSSRLSARNVFTPARSDVPLPYLDSTIDVVAIADDSSVVLAEARRVARRTVVRFVDAGADGNGAGARGPSPVVEHRADAPPGLPSASVVIPTYNGIPQLVPCLRALDETLPRDFAGEVLAVDDASNEETASELRRLEDVYDWLRVIRNERNAGFLATCNRGAEEARGEFVVFLNDDTVPLPGWLGALLRTFRTHPDAGAVGGLLLFPDGRVQEAGGVVFEDASGANFGRNDHDADSPLYGYVRRVDYCSGALLATPRSLFRELGGFDTRYRPIYYEDTDYCFAVRGAGLEVYYQPESMVVHVEGATSGTDETVGLKRYQARNRDVFRAKWREELRQQGTPPGSYNSLTWHRLAFQRR